MIVLSLPHLLSLDLLGYLSWISILGLRKVGGGNIQMSEEKNLVMSPPKLCVLSNDERLIFSFAAAARCTLLTDNC